MTATALDGGLADALIMAVQWRGIVFDSVCDSLVFESLWFTKFTSPICLQTLDKCPVVIMK